MNAREGTPGSGPGTDFIRQIVAADTESRRYGGNVVTRFPPEPNGYLHVGHATAICLNFGIARDFGGRCHLRFDDTNPDTEREEFVVSIQEDVRWLGFDWGEHLYFASDCFERMYGCAELLIEKGLAYVDSQSTEAIREGRGTVTEPGVESPYRDRPPAESLDLFRGMRAGDFGDGAHVLRGRIDMGSPNMLMRDPVLYRIRNAAHYRQGDAWHIYPLYDYAHCLEDAFEGVTHSICTLEFDNNRELYDWVLDSVGFEEPRPHQYEWAGLDLEGAVLSKRRIAPLIEGGVVSGWDDPRLATLAAYRRRGIPPEAIHMLSELVGVSRTGARTEEAKLNYAIREVLNRSAPRVMAVLDPLKVVLTNYPEGTSEHFEAPYYPHDVPLEGDRSVPFSRELWIERADFEEDPPAGFRRLVPGGEVRLRYAYVIRCDEVVKDPDGRVVELRCSYDEASRGGDTADGRKIRGTVQWVAAGHALDAEVRLFARLFDPPPDKGGEAGDGEDPEPPLNPESLEILQAKVEPSVGEDPPDTRYQFERTGYFWRDPVDGRGERLVFNRIVGLKDTWSRRGRAEPAWSAGDEPTPRASAPDPDPPERARKPAARTLSPEAGARLASLKDDLGVATALAEVLAHQPDRVDFLRAALATHDDPPGLADWIVNELGGLVGPRELTDLPFDGASLGKLAALVDEGAVSRRAAKDVLSRMVASGGDPAELVEALGLRLVSDPDALGAIVDSVLAEWPEKVDEYRNGKRGLIGLFVGETMKRSGGAADPEIARTLLTERLEA